MRPSSPNASPLSAGWASEEANSVRKMGLKLGLALLFVRVSMIHEVITFVTGIDTKLLYIFGVPLLLTIAGSGAFGRTFQNRWNWAWIWFIGCMTISSIFSTWFGGSVSFLLVYLRTCVPLLLVTGGFAFGWEDCKKIMNTFAAAAVVNVLTSNLFSYQDGGRMSVSFGSVANSNDLAAHLLLVMPFLLYVLIKPKTGKLVRAGSGLFLAWGLYVVVGTASRGALIALGGVALVALWKGSNPQRISLVVGGTLAAAVLIAVLPPATLNRLMSFSADSSSASEEAIASTEARTYLLNQSIDLSVHNPILGVGPNQFSNIVGKLGKERGVRIWQETHNFFTQISSECGIPALLFYLAAVVAAFVTTNRTYNLTRRRPELNELRSATFCLLLSMVGFGIASFFLNLAYHFYWLALTGLATSISRSAGMESLLESERQKKPMYAPTRPLRAALG
jgi:O-antigen ligase